MDLIEELQTDVALALLVKRKHVEQLDADEAISLIGKIGTTLDSGNGTPVAADTRDISKSASV
ncbi:MAG: hypothetical protein QUS14_06110 [Pyrinomonadaceae bacterium]|nr:hypothetical protein [Pyrinomonadaceae bacterium]